MSIAIASLYLSNFADVMQSVNDNKKEYCRRHGYQYLTKTEGFSCPELGFDKIAFMLAILKDKSIEYLWWQDADTLITNMTLRVEDYMQNKKDIAIGIDTWGVSAGSFIVRNTPELNALLWAVYDKRYVYKEELSERGWYIDWSEQAYLQIFKEQPKYAHLYDSVYLRDLNSFHFYEPKVADQDKDKDIFWQKGDWLVHFTGMPNDARTEQIAHYLHNNIVRYVTDDNYLCSMELTIKNIDGKIIDLGLLPAFIKHAEDQYNYVPTILNQINNDGLYDRAFQVLRQVKDRKAVVIDIGANAGMFSIAVAGENMLVYAYEPATACMEVLKSVAALTNRCIVVNQCAVSGTDGTMTLHLCNGNHTANTLLAGGEAYPDSEEVKTVTLNSIVKLLSFLGHPTIDLIKMDAEGAEPLIIDATNLDYWKKINALFIEFHDFPDLSNTTSYTWFFKGMGYTVEKLGADTLYCYRKTTA